jgi:MFS family permease
MEQSAQKAIQSETPQYEPSEVRRSYRLILADVTFYQGSLTFLDVSTLLPTFLGLLTGSTIVVGAVTALKSAGMLLPQLWTAHYLCNRTTHKPYLIKTALISRIAFFLFALLLFIAGPNDRSLMLWGLLAMCAAVWFSEGWVTVSWIDLVAKAIPERLRGRLFGLTQVTGGFLSILMSVGLVKYMLSDRGPAFPKNYAVLYLVAALWAAASLIALAFVHEPKGIVEEHDGSFFQYLGKIASMISGHSQLKRLLLIQLLMSASGLALPFYILYAKEAVGIGGGTVGVLMSVQWAGAMAFSALVGYVNDHLSPKCAIVVTIFVSMIPPAAALIAGNSPLWLYGIIFFALGVTISAWIGITNFLLEMVEPHERKSYIGVMNTANSPTMLFPALGGLIVQTMSYHAVFALTAVMLVAALVFSLTLQPLPAPIHEK